MSDRDTRIRNVLRYIKGCTTDEQYRQTYRRVEEATALARYEALEEAARACERSGARFHASMAWDVEAAICDSCAAAIRALKDNHKAADI